MTASLQFSGPAARVLRTAAEKIVERRGAGRRVGEFTALIGGLIALSGEREMAGSLYEAADTACVDDDSLVFEVLCRRVGVPFRGYSMDGGVKGAPPAVLLEQELLMRRWVGWGGERPPESGSWRDSTPGMLPRAALATARVEGSFQNGDAHLPPPDREHDSALACHAAINALLAGGADLQANYFHELAATGAMCAARAGDIQLAGEFLRHWLDAAQQHRMLVAPAEVLVPEALCPLVLEGALHDQIAVSPTELATITADVVAAVQARVAAGRRT